jgi:two-component system, cell cycle sensor histidine kinase and response regulator CckA
METPRFLHGRTILVVDDIDLVLRLTCEVLTEHGFRTLPAADGKDALQLCKNKDLAIDAVLADVIMPVMDGMQLYEEIKAQALPQKVILTSVSSLPAAFRLKYPECRFVTKSHDFSELLVALKESLLEAPTPALFEAT